jgi:hypothetical protein
VPRVEAQIDADVQRGAITIDEAVDDVDLSLSLR